MKSTLQDIIPLPLNLVWQNSWFFRAFQLPQGKIFFLHCECKGILNAFVEPSWSKNITCIKIKLKRKLFNYRKIWHLWKSSLYLWSENIQCSDKIGFILKGLLQVHILGFDEFKACWASFPNYREIKSFITGWWFCFSASTEFSKSAELCMSSSPTEPLITQNAAFSCSARPFSLQCCHTPRFCRVGVLQN